MGAVELFGEDECAGDGQGGALPRDQGDGMAGVPVRVIRCWLQLGITICASGRCFTGR